MIVFVHSFYTIWLKNVSRGKHLQVGEGGGEFATNYYKRPHLIVGPLVGQPLPRTTGDLCIGNFSLLSK